MIQKKSRITFGVINGGGLKKAAVPGLKAEFDQLYRAVLPYYKGGELALINGIGNAADGDFLGIEGLRSQVIWLRAELESCQKAAEESEESSD